MTVSTKGSPEEVIHVENLSKSYGSVQAVVGLSFEVRKGEIFGFLDPNGAGKTTTLTFLASFPPDMMPDSLNAVNPGCRRRWPLSSSARCS